MLPIKTILHPNDFSAHSEEAFHLACSLARDYKAQLVVLHVATPAVLKGGVDFEELDAENYRHTLEHNIMRLQGAGFPISVVFRMDSGDPSDMILRVVKEQKADMVVMGTHGRTGFGRVLMGSIAERVLRKATCPVVTVRMAKPVAEHTRKPRPMTAEKPTEVHYEELAAVGRR